MHDIWNPWHGCKKCSEGCQNCYMYYLDGLRGQSGADIYRTKAGFRYPLSKDRSGRYKVQSGEMLRVCMTSDFFLAEADQSWWQVLPVGPTSAGDSPYQSPSAFAGNPYFIDLDLLVVDGHSPYYDR